jgi:hypothetical protein
MGAIMRSARVSPSRGARNAVVAFALATLAVTGVGCRSLRWRHTPSAEALLSRSIAYHDPAGVWRSRPLALEIRESRPDANERTTTIALDPAAGTFDLDRRDGDTVIEGRIAPDECFWNMAAGNFSSEDLEGLTCESLRRTRDTYTYLWGLPMKLRDPGTRLGPVTRVEVDGERRLRMRVTYDPEVGTDVWDFDFDRKTGALAGYRFFHDEAAGDGESITLEGELEEAGLRLPRERAWYTHADHELLGTDRLVAIR